MFYPYDVIREVKFGKAYCRIESGYFEADAYYRGFKVYRVWLGYDKYRIGYMYDIDFNSPEIIYNNIYKILFPKLKTYMKEKNNEKEN